MSDDGQAWTTDGYGSAVIALGIETRMSDTFQVEIPEWAGAVVVALVRIVSDEELQGTLRLVEKRKDRDALALVARLAGPEAFIDALTAAVNSDK